MSTFDKYEAADFLTHFGDFLWLAQTFIATENYQCTQIEIVILDTFDNVDDADTYTVELWGIDGSRKPLVTDIKSTCTPVAQKVSDLAGWKFGNIPPKIWQTFTLDTPTDLLNGTEYAVVIIGNNSSGIASVSTDSTELYTNGIGWKTADDGSTWTAANRSADFRMNGVFNPSTVTPTDLKHDKKLVAVANNELWYESTSGVMSELAAANNDMDCQEILNLFEGYGKVFVVNNTNLKIADFQNVKITTADIGANPPDSGTVLTGVSSGAKMVVDYIDALTGAVVLYGQSITSATFTNGETVTGADNDGNAISFVTTIEVAGPFWYDWTVYGNSTDYGAMPPAATLGCLWNGRAVIAGNPQAPHQWYMARQAKVHDFLYGINDAQSAVAGNNADAGEIGDLPTALIPYKDDWLIVGCVSTCWLFTGDPTNGGALGELDLTTGIFGAQAWCWGKENELYFWGLNGIYKVMLPGGSPVCVSEIRLPALVDDEAASPETHRINLTYDKRRAGVKVDITLLADGSNSCYWYDFRTDGFFPESYPNSCGVYSSVVYDSIDPDYKDVIYGCNDGYLRSLDDSAKDDDITSGTQLINSHVTFGPFLLSDFAANEGKITGLDIILAGGGAGGSQPDSDGATYELYTAKSAEKVLELMAAGTMKAAGTITGPGRSRNTFRKKIRGVYGGIKLKNATVAQTWALEQVLIKVSKAGGLR